MPKQNRLGFFGAGHGVINYRSGASGLRPATATAAGVGAAAATGLGINAVTASATGAGVAAAVGTAVTAVTISSAGSGVATGVGTAVMPSVVSSTGTGAATATGSAVLGATASATGAGAATASALAIFSGTATATGTGAANSVGASIGAGVASATGVGSASGVGAAIAAASASASGVGAASGVIEGLGFINPDADSSTGTWTNEANGLPLFPSIDEHITPNDSDFIKSVGVPHSDTCKVSLSDIGGGTVSEPFRISYRYGKAGTDQIDLTVRLVQGTTVIKAWTHTNVSTTPTSVRQTLSTVEFNSITNTSDLFLEFMADAP
jgi:hypothetical protein